MAEVNNLSNNYVVDDQVVTSETQSTPQTTNTTSTTRGKTITVANDADQSTQTQQTTLQELPQTGVNSQAQPPFIMISVSLFLIAAGILLGFNRLGGEA